MCGKDPDKEKRARYKELKAKQEKGWHLMSDAEAEELSDLSLQLHPERHPLNYVRHYIPADVVDAFLKERGIKNLNKPE